MKKIVLSKNDLEKKETKLNPCEMHGNGLNVVSLNIDKFEKYLSELKF